MTLAHRTAVLGYRQPLALVPLLTFLGQRAVAGIEQAGPDTYKRSVSFTHGWGIVELRGEAGHVSCRLELEDVRDRASAVTRCRRLLDLDADPHTIESALARDGRLRPVVARQPGLRVPGTLDAEELAIRAVLGQQVSVAAARTSAARLVGVYGRPLVQPSGAITHLWPSMEVLAGSDLQELKVPRARRDTVRNLAGALADQSLRLDEMADGDEVRERLLALPGIGPWTASYIAMRALKDPDAFIATDLGVKRGAVALGLPAE
ncbi:MAG TPA: AlkA N-terminal domain-containing protein, partial [Actinomycetota bacterium]|nr:AlkA N-terminal domain-containing protein [Actinomycetota bacterium]